MNSNNMAATLSPYGAEVLQHLTLAQVRAELEPNTCRATVEATQQVCDAWRMTDAQRIEQLQLVLALYALAEAQ